MADKPLFLCNLFPEFSLRKHLICMRFLPHTFNNSKAFSLLSEELCSLSTNMQKKLAVTIVPYYGIQKEQPTIWDAKIRPKCVHAGVCFFLSLFFCTPE